MANLFSPKQVAQAIGVSESSLKRWCDQGLLPMVCTAGGHRRLPMSGVLEFIQKRQHVLVDPQALGLPQQADKRKLSFAEAKTAIRLALIAGDEPLCRQLLLNLYLDGHKFSAICDQILVESFQAIGDLWKCSELEVYQERRACRIGMRLLHDLRPLLVAPVLTGPVAIGGAPAGDEYDLPTTMVELVLRQRGWQASSLGNNLPFGTLAAAVVEYQPRLFWLSVSCEVNEVEFVPAYQAFYQIALAQKTVVVTGGRGLTESLRKQLHYAAFCDNLQHLETFIESVVPTGRDAAVALPESPAPAVS